MASRAKAKAPEDPETLLRATKEPDFRQERSRRSYLALIEAAAALFSSHGYDAVGTPEIAQRAGVSVGTFYRYFDDKHEVYLEICRRNMIAAYRETIEGLGPDRFVGRARHETISETIAVLFEHVLERPQLSRSFTEMSLRDPEVAQLRRAFETVSIQRLSALIAAIVPRTVVPDPEATAYVLYGSAMQCAAGLAGHVGAPPVSAERAKQALADFIERALFPATTA
ncbi:MAG: TetR/AcrR family transcriptional regulator [Deltaproteobacteria bacterium]|nr:TetR/AcrR family transcriptional regulator [Deltaproteobacteria bacterium]